MKLARVDVLALLIGHGGLAVPERPGLGWEPDAARIERFRLR